MNPTLSRHPTTVRVVGGVEGTVDFDPFAAKLTLTGPDGSTMALVLTGSAGWWVERGAGDDGTQTRFMVAGAYAPPDLPATYGWTIAPDGDTDDFALME